MTGLTGAAVGVLFGCAVFLMLKRDLIKMAAGTVLASNAAIMFVMAAGFGQREEALVPMPRPEAVSDPLVQALALTAVVIGFGLTALLLKIGLAVEEAHGTIDFEELAAAEREEEARLEADAGEAPTRPAAGTE